MPLNFSDEEYLKCFQTLYEYLWIEIEKEYDFWTKKNKKVIQSGKKNRYNFPRPEKFVLTKSIHVRVKYRNNHKSGLIIPSEEKKSLYNNLLNDNAVKLESKNTRQFVKLELVQEVEPTFIHEYINNYFNIKYTGQKSIDKKFEIIREISKYKTVKTIDFLQKVNAVETNISLRREAFMFLQQLNVKVILRRNKKGRKKESQILEYMVEDTPDNLIEKVYEDNLEKIKDFDIFLSHSSSDKENVVLLYKNLNNQNFHVYIDWVNDKYALKRNLLNKNTANVIIQRLIKSKVVIYFHSESSLKSQWIPWEIGFFHGLGKPIFVFNPNNLELPYFLQIYPILHFNDSVFFVNFDGQQTTFII
ncbi:MAG: toll/interleukin-1 receptor domain-containing protein [Ignavibacteria bacterium]|nr:toll/interleukin-1 receptor domain-containing protein [Ignavibacteria bacterium]